MPLLREFLSPIVCYVTLSNSASELHSVKLRWGPQIVSVGSARIEFSAPPTEAGLRLRNLALRALAGACFTLVITTS